jgi:nucleoside-diphosphate-sugar epimerase
MNFTIFGGSGFIGRNLAAYLRQEGFTVNTPSRADLIPSGQNLGHVIYTIGMTGNFRTRLHDTIDAHVHALERLMKGAHFDSWLYLSSTRVYQHANPEHPAHEDDNLSVKPGKDGLYDLSKLLGEALCLSHDNQAVRVARLSNVYGPGMSPDLFLGGVMREIHANGNILIREDPQSCKDYINVDDLVPVLAAIARRGAARMYNVASGKTITHAAIADVLTKSGYGVSFAPGAVRRALPPIDTSRLLGEFGILPCRLLADLPALIEQQRSFFKEKS